MFRRGLVRRCAGAAPTKERLKIIECPRDAMQGLHKFVPTDQKIRYHTALLQVGYDTLDCVSFVPPKAVPQLRDSEEVLAAIGPLVRMPGAPSARCGATPLSDTKLLAVVANVRGAAKALQQPSLTYIGYPLSVSETFQMKNTNRDIASALEDLAEIKKLCDAQGKQLVTYISMAFGNPYREAFRPDDVTRLAAKVAALGVTTLSLADTVGSGSNDVIRDVYQSVARTLPKEVDVGLHLHATTAEAYGKVLSAIEAGCRRFDSAVAGMGGCPFAQDGLTGNVPTETVVEAANKLGLAHGLDVGALERAKAVAHEVWGTSIKELFIAAVVENERMLLDLCISSFNEHDTHKVGFLTYDQFAEAMQGAYGQLGEPAKSPEKMRAKFLEMDFDHDNRITFDEFMMFTRHALARRLRKYMHE